MKTDMELKDDVLAELEFEPSVNAAHVGVTAIAAGVNNVHNDSIVNS